MSIEADGNCTLTILTGVIISANGGATSQKDSNDRNGGGGSGGSLRFAGKSIINNGTISAKGGTGAKLPSGGGGRVSFSYSYNLTQGTVDVGSGNFAGTINESTRPIIVGDLNATATYVTANYMSYSAGMMGSVFTGVNNNSYLDLGGSTYQHSTSRVLIGNKAGSLLAL